MTPSLDPSEGNVVCNMKKGTIDLSTDVAWEEWGRREPYFGVITDPKYRRQNLTEEARHEFFDSGRWHVDNVLNTIRKHVDPTFAPRSILDFGCGVGRTLVAFASLAPEVVGLDVSPSMLEEAQRNCALHDLKNVRLLESDDSLSALDGKFDLLHSFIVFQHIPFERGREIVSKLMGHIAPGGIGVMQFTFAKRRFSATYGVAPAQPRLPPSAARPTPPDADPDLQMNDYNLNEIFFLLVREGIQHFHAEFTDHGGELGLFTFFQKS